MLISCVQTDHSLGRASRLKKLVAGLWLRKVAAGLALFLVSAVLRQYKYQALVLQRPDFVLWEVQHHVAHVHCCLVLVLLHQ